MPTRKKSPAKKRPKAGRWQDQLAPSSDRGAGRVAVLTALPDIREALSKGYSLKDIHTAMTSAGELSISYSTFASHCKKAGLAAGPSQGPRSAGAAAQGGARKAGFSAPATTRKEDVV